EYGHFIAHHLVGIGTIENQVILHEAFADTLAVLAFDTETVGRDHFGCGEDLRTPRAGNPQFPRCPGDPCSTPYSSAEHCLGELLPALWRDLHDELGDAAVRELFLDWIMITQGQSEIGCLGSIYPDQAADRGTLVEVLEVAGNQQS